MDSFFLRFKNPLTLIAILLVQVIALAIQVPHQASGYVTEAHHDGPKVTLLRYWIGASITPFERLSHGTSSSVRGLWSNYINLRHTRQQNEDLQREVQRLRQEQEEFAEDAAQGRRLQALLQFKQRYVTSTVAAQIIGVAASDRSSVLTLDKGSADGLKPDQPVITPDGAVGKIRDVWPHTAQLLLLNDASSGAGVVLTGSRIRGIVHGNSNGLVTISNLLSDSRIKVGETVVTSGGDGVFPRGLPVGTVQAIKDPDPSHQPYTLITIKPNANLAQLEEVLIITGTDTTMTAVAQADANSALDAAAAAEANKRAADMVAEKLPGISGASGSTGTTGTQDENNLRGQPGIPNSGLPKYQPPAHPDRYSPNSAPPATDLTPGAPAPKP